MIKIIYLVFFLFFLNNCSFDNKTGIWTGSDKIAKKKDINKENLEFIFKKDNQIIQEKKHGLAVLWISEDLDELMELTDRIAVIFRGKFVRILERDEASLELLGRLMTGMNDSN